jgi:hypothetical protein
VAAAHHYGGLLKEERFSREVICGWGGKSGLMAARSLILLSARTAPGVDRRAVARF